MFKKTAAIVALVTAGMMAQAPIVSAHQSNKYHSHKNQVQKKHHGKKKYGQKHHNKKAHNNKYRKLKKFFRKGVRRAYGRSLPQIRRQLRNRGYYRINYTDRRLPVYKARACKNGKRFNMRINRNGGIMWRKRIGYCR